MHIHQALLASTLLFSSLLTSSPKLHAESPPPIEVITKQFGILSKGANGLDFQLTDQVPLIIGQQFGWRLKVQTDRAEVVVREEQTLAEPPSTFGTGDRVSSISEDGKTCTTVMHLEPDSNGIISNTWVVAKGDPLGPASFRLFIDDALAANFLFEFVNDINATDDIGVPVWPKQKHPSLPPFLEQQLERIKTALTTSEQYLKSIDTAIEITALRVRTANRAGDEAELQTAQTHLYTLTEERKNVEASTALLERAVKEMVATLARREAVARQMVKAGGTSKDQPKGKSLPPGDGSEPAPSKQQVLKL